MLHACAEPPFPALHECPPRLNLLRVAQKLNCVVDLYSFILPSMWRSKYVNSAPRRQLMLNTCSGVGIKKQWRRAELAPPTKVRDPEFQNSNQPRGHDGVEVRYAISM